MEDKVIKKIENMIKKTTCTTTKDDLHILLILLLKVKSDHQWIIK